MYEPITVEIDRNYGDGTYRSQHIKFTGRLVKLIKKGPTAMRLYEWVDRGYVIYLVHVNEEKPRRLPGGEVCASESTWHARRPPRRLLTVLRGTSLQRGRRALIRGRGSGRC